MLDWCLQNSLPWKKRQDDWNIITYEQLVIQPEPVVSHLTKTLQLNNPENIRRQLASMSRTTKKSTKENRRTLEKLKSQGDRSLIIKKWKKKIAPAEEERLMETLSVFNMDLYKSGEILPNRAAWVGNAYDNVQV